MKIVKSDQGVRHQLEGLSNVGLATFLRLIYVLVLVTAACQPLRDDSAAC